MVEILKSAGLLLGGSWATGFNLYLTVAGLGIAQRMGYVQLPGSMETIASPWIIGIAIVLYIIEFVADKVPYVDSIWDTVHTAIRPLGSMALAMMAMGDADPVLRWGTALACGAVTLDSHLLKATTRVAINTSPEPVSNSVASVAEDGIVVGLLILMAKHPIISGVIVVLFLIFSVWFFIFMFKFLKKVFTVKKKDNDLPVEQQQSANDDPKNK